MKSKRGPRFIDITGERFGRLLVIGLDEGNAKNTSWQCRCDCGQTKVVIKSNLKAGRTKSCGCLLKNNGLAIRLDLAGQRFGKLVAVEYSHTDGNRTARWLCQCDCGSQAVIRAHSLASGRAKSCGCSKRRLDGLSNTPEYKIWESMRRRCSDPKTINYKYYGGRGISVCQRWEDTFKNFYADMGPRPSPLHSIDRKNNDGNYEPGNCGWATDLEQGANKRQRQSAKLG
jgi:hypothetical protein